jgi:hypothetical protein
MFKLVLWIHLIDIEGTAQSEAWTVFARSYTEIVGSNPTGGMDVCVRFCVVLCVGAVLQRTDPPSKESYRLCIRLVNWKRGQGPTTGL